MPAALSLINDALPHLFPGIRDAFLRTKVKDILFDGVRISCKDSAVGECFFRTPFGFTAVCLFEKQWCAVECEADGQRP